MEIRLDSGNPRHRETGHARGPTRSERQSIDVSACLELSWSCGPPSSDDRTSHNTVDLHVDKLSNDLHPIKRSLATLSEDPYTRLRRSPITHPANMRISPLGLIFGLLIPCLVHGIPAPGAGEDHDMGSSTPVSATASESIIPGT